MQFHHFFYFVFRGLQRSLGAATDGVYLYATVCSRRRSYGFEFIDYDCHLVILLSKRCQRRKDCLALLH